MTGWYPIASADPKPKPRKRKATGWRHFELDGRQWCVNPHGIVMLWDPVRKQGDYGATFRLDKGPVFRAAEAEAQRLGFEATCGPSNLCSCPPRW